MATTVADADVSVHADVSAFAKELKAKLEPIVKSIGKDTKVKVGVEVDNNAIRNDVDRLEARLAAAFKKKFDVPLNIDDNSSRSLFSKLADGFTTVTDKAAQFGSTVASGVGSAFEALSSIAGPVLIGLGAIIVVRLIGTLITLSGVVAGLTAGLAALAAVAASALGVFAVAAIPIFSKVITAVQGGNAEIKKLPIGLQGAANAIVRLKTAFSNWLVPFEKPLGGVIVKLAQLGQQILPMLTPVITAMTGAFSTFVDHIGAGLQSTPILTFFNNLATVGPHVFLTLADAAGHFGLGLIAIINALTPFASQLADKIGSVAKKFDAWANSAKGQNAIHEFVDWLKTSGKKAAEGLAGIAQQIPGLISKLSSKDVKKDLGDLETTLRAVSGTIDLITSSVNAATYGFQTWVKWIEKAIDALSRLNPFSSNKKDDSKKISAGTVGEVSGKGKPGPAAPAPAASAFGLNGVNIDFSGLEQKAQTAVVSIVATLSSLGARAAVALSGLPAILFTAGSIAFSGLEFATSTGVSLVVSTIGSITSRAVGALSTLGGSLFNTGYWALNSMAQGIGTATGLVSRAAIGAAQSIVNAFSGVYSSAYGAGYGIVSRIAAGIRAAIRLVTSAASAVAGAISSFLPGSPVDQGPLTVLNQGYTGGKISQMIADGIVKGAPLIDRAMSNALSVPAQTVRSAGVTTNNTVTKAPNIYVSSPAANPMDVALAAIRQARLVGAF